MTAPTAGAGDPSAAHSPAQEQLAPDMPAEDYRGAPTPGFDPSVPSPARMYDYYLGGKDHFPADRQAAELALSVVPFGREVARASRQFMVRAVQYRARGGIDQFIDLGRGGLGADRVGGVVVAG